MNGLRWEVPVVPDADTAREWAEAELSRAVYHEQPSLLSRALDWLMERIAAFWDAFSGADPGASGLLLVGILVAVIAVALLVAGPLRRSRSARPSTEVFAEDARSAAELSASADALAAAGRWNEAVLDRFRAILRSLVERAVLEERPGLTADEASAEAGAALPTCAADLRLASRLFDDVCYGDRQAERADDEWLREVAAAVRDARRTRATRGVETLAVPR